MSKIVMQAFGLAAFLVFSVNVLANVSVPNVFNSHMVMQRNVPLPVWGQASPGEKVSVSLGDNKKDVTADANGSWNVKMPAMKTSNSPLQMIIEGQNKLVFTDILIGEVWLCSGQSNMEFGIGMSDNATAEIAAANYPQIRLFQIPRLAVAQPAANVNANWKVCTPENISEGGWHGFSAAAYFFGRMLHKKLNVPVGLINSSWGGTRIEPWTCPEGFAMTPKLKSISTMVSLADPSSDAYKARIATYMKTVDAWVEKAHENIKSEVVLASAPTFPKELYPLRGHGDPCALYNGMIYPIVPFAIRGAIWYQGESNRRDAMMYYEKTKALVNGWRKIWEQESLPFYYVQIAPYHYGNETTEAVPEMWEAQTACLSIPDTGMIVTTDIGNYTNIHPTNKQEVGRRLALWALAKTYGQKEIVYSGPMFQSMSIEGNQLRIQFSHIGSGLDSRDKKPLTWFEIIGEEGGFVKATAVIDGDSILLSSPEVAHPVAVRFAWNKAANSNFMNKEGLPAISFRAGKVPYHDPMTIYVSESKDYKLVYSLDLAKISENIKYDIDNHAEISTDFDRIAYYLELE
ncbi:MAG: sialate O-acetylesterase, partial [Lentisphaeria bacterium]